MYVLAQVTQTIPKGQTIADEVSRLDPWGVGMMVIGMVIVFGSLLLLFVLFSNISRAIRIKSQAKQKIITENVTEQKEAKTSNNGINAEIATAIATALHLYLAEQHDNEQAILTIQRVSRSYSPWSSKLYGLRNHPRA